MLAAKQAIPKLIYFIKINDHKIYEEAFYGRVLQESYKYLEIEDDIKRVIKEKYKTSCLVHKLGSRVIGLANTESDLDFFINLNDENYFVERNYDGDLCIIEELKSYLEKIPKQWLVKKINPSIPSLKAVHNETGILCDISVTNGMAVQNSQLLAHVFGLQTECVAFYHYVKNWLLCFNVRFKGFTLTLLVLYFFQRLGFLPSIKDVQKGIPPQIIDGYEVQFDNSRDRDYYQLKEMNYFKVHVKDFFSFYAKFDYDNYVICTYSGRAVHKNKYSTKIDSNHPITIAAPLLRRTNCSKYLTNLDVSRFIEAFQVSHKFLSNHRAAETFIYSREYLDFCKL